MVKLAHGAVAAANLSDLVINTPCPMDWNRMDGDDRKRFCSRCEKHVYNIEEMTEHEALQVIENLNGDFCARIFRRPDGTIVTSECPKVGKRTSGRWFQFSIATLVTLLTSSAGLFAAAPWIARQIEPFTQSWFGQTPMTGIICVGEIAPPAPSIAPPVTAPVSAPTSVGETTE